MNKETFKIHRDKLEKMGFTRRVISASETKTDEEILYYTFQRYGVMLISDDGDLNKDLFLIEFFQGNEHLPLSLIEEFTKNGQGL